MVMKLKIYLLALIFALHTPASSVSDLKDEDSFLNDYMSNADPSNMSTTNIVRQLSYS